MSRPALFMDRPCRCCGQPTRVMNGAWFAHLRTTAGLSLREVARRIKISAPYLCDMEHNRRSIPEGMGDRITGAINRAKS